MLMTSSEFREKYKISQSLETKQRRLGTGPKYIKIGNKIMYRESDIDEWLSSNTFSSRLDELNKAIRDAASLPAFTPPSGPGAARLVGETEPQKLGAARCLMAANGVVASTTDENDPVVGFLVRGGA